MIKFSTSTDPNIYRLHTAKRASKILGGMLSYR
jgi:hypothetical protein